MQIRNRACRHNIGRPSIPERMHPRATASLSARLTAKDTVSGQRSWRLGDHVRTEHDLLGEREVPSEAYYGVHTMRAVENFPISGIAISAYPELIGALAAIKQAAALSNMELGLLDQRRGRAIVAACEELRAGRLHDQFVVDVIQGGAGRPPT